MLIAPSMTACESATDNSAQVNLRHQDFRDIAPERWPASARAGSHRGVGSGASDRAYPFVTFHVDHRSLDGQDIVAFGGWGPKSPRVLTVLIVLFGSASVTAR